MILLDVTHTDSSGNPDQVVSAEVMDVLLGDPQSHLLIFTGIGLVNFGSDDGPNRDTARIRLGRTVTQLPADGQFSATVGLASIGNTESDFIFATDKVDIDLDPDGTLVLTCDLAVQGDESGLNRMSYQLNVIIQVVPPQLTALLVSNLEPSGGLNQPPGPPIFGPSVILGVGVPWGGRVVLDRPAPAPGVFVNLSSSNQPVAGVPVSVPVLAGATAGDFPGNTTGFVNVSTDITITAQLGSVQQTALVTVEPPAR
jgi:hypothetical protein